jgi:hypothetical protein
MALLPGSPAIDAGDDSVCPPTDQRGVARPQGLACDIGAFELAPKLTLSRSAEGKVKIQYRFQGGKTHQVFGSSDLAHWDLLGTGVSDTNGAFEFEDAEAPNLPRRFYHVQPQLPKPLARRRHRLVKTGCRRKTGPDTVARFDRIDECSSHITLSVVQALAGPVGC